MNSSAVITNINAAKTTHDIGHDPQIDRALDLLLEAGISFEVVDRCPAACGFCDDALPHAA